RPQHCSSPLGVIHKIIPSPFRTLFESGPAGKMGTASPPSGCGVSARCILHEDPDEEVEAMTATSARPAEGVATAGEPASPPVRRVQARAPLTEDSLLARGKVTPGSADAA